MTRRFRHLLAIVAIAMSPACASAAPAGAAATDGGAEIVRACKGRTGWADIAPPARIFGNVWYVGTCGISAVLITGKQGHILVDGGLPEAAPLVLANIRTLGFNPADVHWIVPSHEHFDHAGALSALQKATGAQIAALPATAGVLADGKPDASDPQAADLQPFPPARVDKVLADGETLRLGELAVTVRATPAHTAGSSSWTWTSCDARKTCRTIAYADSATAISADGYRFTDHPDRNAAVRAGLARIAGLPCDVLITPHPSASDLFDRLGGVKPLVNPNACRTYAQAATQRFDARLSSEKKPS